MLPAPISAAPMTLTELSTLNLPSGLALIPGGGREAPLSFSPPPNVFLGSHFPNDMLQMLRFAGVHYSHSGSDAALMGIRVFQAARDFARRGTFEAVTFDWDHTLSNYQVIDNIAELIQVRSSKTEPAPDLAATPMTAIEVARPFMHELAFGMMAGFALRQGVKFFSDWEHYHPQVGLVTHTWPDRIGILATHFVRLLPLMEGLIPGSPNMYRHMTGPSVWSVVHLHHLLSYAEALLRTFDDHGFAPLTPAERGEVLAYLADGKAHVRKPLGALALRGWETSSLMHFDDSTIVIEDLLRVASRTGSDRPLGVHVRQPHSRVFRDVKEWHKIALSALWSGRDRVIGRVVRNLARMEWESAPLPSLVGALGVYGDNIESTWPVSGLPEGVVMMVHQTPTTLGEFWRYYVEPTHRLKSLIRDIRKKHGGLRSIRRAYLATLDLRRLPPGRPEGSP